MGMYDNLKCERIMPDGYDGRKTDFQTKSLDCLLDNYTITKDGRFLRKLFWFKGQPEPEEKLFPLTGEIVFYDYQRQKDEWHEYRAVFRRGKLKRLTSVPEGSRRGRWHMFWWNVRFKWFKPKDNNE